MTSVDESPENLLKVEQPLPNLLIDDLSLLSWIFHFPSFELFE